MNRSTKNRVTQCKRSFHIPRLSKAPSALTTKGSADKGSKDSKFSERSLLNQGVGGTTQLLSCGEEIPPGLLATLKRAAVLGQAVASVIPSPTSSPSSETQKTDRGG